MRATIVSRRAQWYRRILKASIVLALGMGPAAAAGADPTGTPDSPETATPIKHVIVVIGENRGFDHVYATYISHGGQSILNLLSEGIVQPNGAPGPNFAAARQFRTSGQKHYLIGVPISHKTPYSTLPAPTLGGAPNAQSATLPPFFSDLLPFLAALEPSLEPADLPLLTTGATGAAVRSGAPDTRIANYAALAS
jgi:phospholipase C